MSDKTASWLLIGGLCVGLVTFNLARIVDAAGRYGLLGVAGLGVIACLVGLVSLMSRQGRS